VIWIDEAIMKDLRLALVQMTSEIGNAPKNLRALERMTADASSKGADMICFPEMSISGYTTVASELSAEQINGESALSVARMSQEYGISIAAGMAEASDGKIYITHFLAENGSIAGSYRKTHLGRREIGCFQPGDRIRTLDSRSCRIGFQLCWESHFPDISSTLALQGADLILMPHASTLTSWQREDIWKKILPARGYDNTLYVAACNQTGGAYSGGLMIVGPKGDVIGRYFDSSEYMLMVDLASEPLERIRCGKSKSMRDLYYLAHRRLETYTFED
jgi:predicted amidohydrolase